MSTVEAFEVPFRVLNQTKNMTVRIYLTGLEIKKSLGRRLAIN